MRVFSPLFSSVLTALSILDIATAFAPAQPPTFETLFVGTWTVGEVLTIPDGTFGTRLHGAVTGSVQHCIKEHTTYSLTSLTGATCPIPRGTSSGRFFRRQILAS